MTKRKQGRPKKLAELLGDVDCPFRRELNRLTFESVLTKQDIAERAGVSYRVFCDYLSGIRDLEFATAVKLAAAMGMDVRMGELFEN